MANYLSIMAIEVQDVLGVTVSHDVFVEVADTTTVAQIVTATQAYCALLDPLTDGAGVGAHVTLSFPSTGMKTGPTALGSPVEQTLLTNFSQAGSRYKFAIDVPTLAKGKIVNGKVDPLDTDVAAWKAWLLAAHTGIQASSKFGNLLQALLDLTITFRKHRRSENKKSTVVIG
jgi:hypothetical protein